MSSIALERPLRFNDSASPKDEGLSTGMLLHSYAKFLNSINRRPATIEQRVGDIQRFQVHYPDLFKVTFDDILAYYEAHSTWSAEYRKKIRSSLIVFYRWANRHGHTDHDPTLDLEPFFVPERDPRPTPEDVVLTAFEDGTLHERAIILLAATMGLRRTEIATLHPRHRDGDRLYIEGKGGAARILTLDPVTLQFLILLEDEQGTDSYYFPGRFGGHIHPATVYSWVKQHIGDPWTLHNCRTRAVQKFLGHRSVATTQKYTAVDDTEVAGVSNATSLAYARTYRKGATPAGEPTRGERISEHAQFLEDLASVTARAKNFGIELTLR